jgi:hypothetical protein
MRVLQAYWLYLPSDYVNAQANMNPVALHVHKQLIHVVMVNQNGDSF